ACSPFSATELIRSSRRPQAFACGGDHPDAHGRQLAHLLPCTRLPPISPSRPSGIVQSRTADNGSPDLCRQSCCRLDNAFLNVRKSCQIAPRGTTLTRATQNITQQLERL